MDDLGVLWCFVFVVDISSYFSRVKMWQRPTLRRRRTLTLGLLQVGVLFSVLFLLRAPERRVLLKKGAEMLHLHTSHLTFAHIASSHLTYSHLMSSHLTSSHLTSGHLTSLNLASADIAYSQLTYSHLMSAHLTSSSYSTSADLTFFSSLLFPSLLFIFSLFFSVFFLFFSSHLFLYSSLFFSSLLFSIFLLFFVSLLYSSRLFSFSSLSSAYFYSLWRPCGHGRAGNLRQLRTKWGSIAKHLGKNAILTSHARPLSTKWGSIATKKEWCKIKIYVHAPSAARSARIMLGFLPCFLVSRHVPQA